MRRALFLLIPVAWLTSASPSYRWERLTAGAAFPGSYNFAVVALRDRFWALHPQGIWSSADGRDWHREVLPASGLNEGYQDHVVFRGAIYALGQLEGNYQRFSIHPRIKRTVDLKTWEVLADSSDLPQRVFYATAVFRDAIWLLGGWDGRSSHNDIWRSEDGKQWERAVTAAPWSPRSNPTAVVFRDRLWLLGGGVMDGKSFGDVWSTTDGRTWTRATEEMVPETPFGYTAVVFDDRLWLVGANRNGPFRSEMLVTEDGASWRPERAPWSPRGGVAAWATDDRLFLTGGKFSSGTGSAQRFIYHNDVWVMRQARP